MTPPTPVPQTGGVTGVLTDGTGVSKLLGSKVLKDLVLDFLLSVPVAFIGLEIADLNGALAAPIAVGLAIGDAAIRVLYRGALRWAQSDRVA